MKELEEKILREGKIYPGNILKVGSFLNHQIDTGFLFKMGAEIERLFRDDKVTKILTIEASGIAIAAAAAYKMNVPFVFAKKQKTSNIGGDSVYSAQIHSYTHGADYNVVVSREFLSPDDNILIIDDFLANGCAAEGLIEIVKAAGAGVCGICAVIEKGFQHGGDKLRERGIKVESLALIESMDEHEIVFRR